MNSSGLVDPEDAIAWIDANSPPLASENIDSRLAAGRILADAVTAPAHIPCKQRSVADGFALRAMDTVGASPYNPLRFQVETTGSMGRFPAPVAIPVTWGSVLPDDTDAVLSRDMVDVDGAFVDVTTPLATGESVLPQAAEAIRGDVILEPGRRLRPQDLALLGMARVSTIKVVRAPRVRIVCMRSRDDDCASPMLSALLVRDGCGHYFVEYANSDSRVFGKLLAAPGADLIVGIGGTGIGNDDGAVAALASAGEVLHHGIALHPGETSALGRVGECPVILLPGTSLAAFVAGDYLACRLVRRMSGAGADWPYVTRIARLTRKISSRLGRLEFCRVRIHGDGAEPLAVADGVTLSTSVRADGFVPIPTGSEGYAAGTHVTIHLYDSFPQNTNDPT
jgi:molybdopterin molybdotransferase